MAVTTAGKHARLTTAAIEPAAVREKAIIALALALAIALAIAIAMVTLIAQVQIKNKREATVVLLLRHLRLPALLLPMPFLRMLGRGILRSLAVVRPAVAVATPVATLVVVYLAEEA